MQFTMLKLVVLAAAVLAHPGPRVEQRDTRQFFGYTDLECAGGTIMTGPVTTGVCVSALDAMASAQIFGRNFWDAQVKFYSDSACQDEISAVTEVGDNEASLCFDLGTKAKSVKYTSSL